MATTPNTPNTPTSPTPELRPAQTDRRYYWFLIIYLVLIISILVFIAGAVISVFSTSMTFFLMCRLIQGMGASGGYFLARTIPADIFHGRELAKFMAIIGAVNGLAPVSATSCTAPPSYSWSCSYSSLSSPSSPTASSPTSTRNTHSVSLRMA